MLKQAAAAHSQAVEICCEELRRELEPWIKLNARPDQLRLDAKKGLLTFQGSFANYRKRVEKRFARGALGKAFDAIAEAIDRLTFSKLSRVPGIDASRIIPGGKITIENFRRKNAELIETLPLEIAQDVGQTLAKPDVRDLHVSEVTELLESRFGVARDKAEFWGRDQTLKLYGQVNEERQIAAGVDRYEWGHSDDERVRGNPHGLYPHSQGDHWRLGTKIFTWSAPPIVNPKTGKRAHPGGDYQCRCTAYPVFD